VNNIIIGSMANGIKASSGVDPLVVHGNTVRCIGGAAQAQFLNVANATYGVSQVLSVYNNVYEVISRLSTGSINFALLAMAKFDIECSAGGNIMRVESAVDVTQAGHTLNGFVCTASGGSAASLRLKLLAEPNTWPPNSWRGASATQNVFNPYNFGTNFKLQYHIKDRLDFLTADGTMRSPLRLVMPETASGRLEATLNAQDMTDTTKRGYYKLAAALDRDAAGTVGYIAGGSETRTVVEDTAGWNATCVGTSVSMDLQLTGGNPVRWFGRYEAECFTP
jgi:hypothetical protein